MNRPGRESIRQPHLPGVKNRSKLRHRRPRRSDFACKIQKGDKDFFPIPLLLQIVVYEACSRATATATEAPTMGLLPMPISPIISTWAGTEEEPANWASECMRPIVSVIP